MIDLVLALLMPTPLQPVILPPINQANPPDCYAIEACVSPTIFPERSKYGTARLIMSALERRLSGGESPDGTWPAVLGPARGHRARPGRSARSRPESRWQVQVHRQQVRGRLVVGPPAGEVRPGVVGGALGYPARVPQP